MIESLRKHVRELQEEMAFHCSVLKHENIIDRIHMETPGVGDASVLEKTAAAPEEKGKLAALWREDWLLGMSGSRQCSTPTQVPSITVKNQDEVLARREEEQTPMAEEKKLPSPKAGRPMATILSRWRLRVVVIRNFLLRGMEAFLCQPDTVS